MAKQRRQGNQLKPSFNFQGQFGMTTNAETKPTISERVKEELELIRKKHSGLLNPVDVVEFAKNEETALHTKFTWDNSKAAHEYRLWEARQVIRVHVTVVAGSDEPVRAFVSLKEDRGTSGYRHIQDVLSDKQLREKMLQEARAEMEVFAKKYRHLQELKPVVQAMDEFIDSQKPKRVTNSSANGSSKKRQNRNTKSTDNGKTKPRSKPSGRKAATAKV